MTYIRSFDSRILDTAHSLNKKHEIVLLTLYGGTPLYAAELINIISEKSNGSRSIRWLEQIYDILSELVDYGLIVSVVTMPGGEKRRHHRSKPYEITPFGKEVISCSEEFRFSLSCLSEKSNESNPAST